MNRQELAEQTGIADNGKLTEMLDDLVASDFIRKNPFFGNRKKGILYQLSDYYTLFYFKFIKDYSGRDEHFWSHSYEKPSHRVWAGLTFEMLCQAHIPEIKNALSIGGVLTEASTWYAGTSDLDESIGRGAQIDLLFDRRDHMINICEIKYVTKENVG